MKIQIASDLHLEFGNRRVPAAHSFRPVPDRDVLVLAGDIGRQRMARFFVERELAISPVIYVPGNHEYYSSRSRASIDGDWREIAAEHPDLHYLVADGVTVGGVRFWGAPWYSDLWGTTDPLDLATVHEGINDFSKSCNGGGEWTLSPPHRSAPGAERPAGDSGRPGGCGCHALAADQGSQAPRDPGR